MIASVMLRFAARRNIQTWGIPFFRSFRHIVPANLPNPGHDVTSKICNSRITLVTCANNSNDFDFFWKRPEGSPRTWRVFEGRKKSENCTSLPRFSIQDVPEERVEDVIDFMLEHLLREENLSVSLGSDLAQDPLAVEDMRTYWRKTMRQGMSIFALLENPADFDETDNVIVGANILTVVTAKDKAELRRIDQFKSEKSRQFWSTVFKTEDELDLVKKYGVDKYLGSVGLAGHPSFRGHGMGSEILRTREDIGRAYKIPVTEAMFTMKSSQISASRAGFQLQLQKKYSELSDHEGKFIFPKTTEKSIYIMTKKFY